MSASSTRTEHPVERFWRRLPELLPEDLHPSRLVPVGDERIEGTGFPGSHGLYAGDSSIDTLPPFPYGGLMLLGHHLQDGETLRNRMAAERTHGDPDRPATTYWERVHAMLDAAHIPRAQVFSTNAHPALPAHPLSEGMLPAEGTEQWRAAAATFLLEQIAVMQPAVIVTLGVAAAGFARRDLGVYLHENKVSALRIGDLATSAVAINHPLTSLSDIQRRGEWGVVGEAWRHAT